MTIPVKSEMILRMAELPGQFPVGLLGEQIMISFIFSSFRYFRQLIIDHEIKSSGILIISISLIAADT
jgi:hypothetical protein